MEAIRQQGRRLLEEDVLRQRESDAARQIQGAWEGCKLRVRLSELKVQHHCQPLTLEKHKHKLVPGSTFRWIKRWEVEPRLLMRVRCFVLGVHGMGVGG